MILKASLLKSWLFREEDIDIKDVPVDFLYLNWLLLTSAIELAVFYIEVGINAVNYP